jgi:hypothetical protein
MNDSRSFCSSAYSAGTAKSMDLLGSRKRGP